jgi:hypothetical protein
VPEALPSAAPVAVAAAPPLGSPSAAAVAAFSSAAVPFVRLATMFWMDEPLASETPSIEEPSAEPLSAVELLAAVACPAAGCCWTPAMTAARDCAKKPRDAGEASVASLFSVLEGFASPVTSSGAAVATVLTLSAACACDCASASMKLGPSELLDAPVAGCAPGPEPAVDWV